MDRYWLLTWTTYGSWLPGDRRDFVGDLRTEDWCKILHNAPGTPCDSNLPALEAFARKAMKGKPILLDKEQAPILLAQFEETAAYRQWELVIAAIMRNHVHLIVGVSGDPKPSYLLQSFKEYASRALNRVYPRTANGTWWTESGSKRKLPDAQALSAGISYLQQQAYPLLIWASRGRQSPGEQPIALATPQPPGD